MTTDDVSERRHLSRRVGEVKTLGRRAQVHHHTGRSVLFARFSSFKEVKLVNIFQSGQLLLPQTWLPFPQNKLVPTGFWNVCFHRKNLLGFKPRTEATSTCTNHQFRGVGGGAQMTETRGSSLSSVLYLIMGEYCRQRTSQHDAALQTHKKSKSLLLRAV